MPDLNKIYLYRMIHIQNIPHILQHGITHSYSPNANPDFVPIGDGSLIAHRNNFRSTMADGWANIYLSILE